MRVSCLSSCCHDQKTRCGQISPKDAVIGYRAVIETLSAPLGDKLDVKMPDEIELPDSLASDPKATELLRVWSSDPGNISVLLNKSFDPGLPAFAFWGMLMADILRHASRDDESLPPKIAAMMLSELGTPATYGENPVDLRQVLALLEKLQEGKMHTPPMAH